MNNKNLILALILCLPIISCEQEDASNKILRSTSFCDLRKIDPYPEEKLFPDLLEELASSPQDPSKWEALHRYEFFTDGGITLYCYRDCFFLFFDDEALLLYNRYDRTGDERVLSLLKKTIDYYDPIAFGDNPKYKIEQVHSTIEDIKNNNPTSERQLLFLKTIEKTWNPKNEI